MSRRSVFVLAALGALVLSSAAAQVGRVTVETNPRVPIVGLPVEARVRFLDATPTRVSVFVRSLGDSGYQELVGTPEGGGVFTATLPGGVPLQGLEAFASYVLNGVTFTEPAQSPQENPFRIPALHPSADADVILPSRQYRMVSVPLVLAGAPGSEAISGLGSSSPREIFGDDFGEDADPARWRLLRFEPRLNRAVDFVADAQTVGPVQPGRGYWLITASGGAFDVDNGLSAGVAFDGNVPFSTDVSVAIGPGWNQIGTPYFFGIDWDDVAQSGLVEDPVAFRGSYEPAQARLVPWEGYFVFNRGPASTLTFPARPFADDGERRSPEATLVARGGAGTSVVRVRVGSGAATDAVYLGRCGAAACGLAADEPDGLTLRKPPAIADGPRLVATTGGAEWAAHLVPATREASWTLALHAAGPAELALDAFGSVLGAFQVDDLDRGATLPVENGRVVVPALAGADVRHLRIRAWAAGGEAAVSVAASPNPTRGRTEVAFVLAAPGRVRAEVFDVRGRQIRVLLDAPREAGPHLQTWDGRDAAGRPVAAGVYVVRVTMGLGTAAARVTVLR